MYIPKHPNYVKASNLMLGTVALGFISILAFPSYLSSTKNIIVSVLSIGFVVALSFLIRQRFDWVKYLILVLFVLGCTSLPFTIMHFAERPLLSSISILQIIMQLWALVLLFKVPPLPKSNAMQQFKDSLSSKVDGSL
jgi:hypothetical protein